jgi:hypothetical protein
VTYPENTGIFAGRLHVRWTGTRMALTQFAITKTEHVLPRRFRVPGQHGSNGGVSGDSGPQRRLKE